MRCERLSADGGDPAELARQLRALVPAPESVREAVAAIIDDVRAGGDDALACVHAPVRHRRRRAAPLRVGRRRARRAPPQALDPAVREGLERAIANVDVPSRRRRSTTRARSCSEHATRRHARRSRSPAQRSTCRAGRAPYPSTVVMGVVPARVAGVPGDRRLRPAEADGDVDPVDPRRVPARRRDSRCTGWAAPRRSPRSHTAPTRSRPSM